MTFDLLGESLQTVWIKALPVLPAVEEDYGDAGVAEVSDDLSSLRVGRDIPIHEVNAVLGEELLREFAGVAGGRGEDSDQGK